MADPSRRASAATRADASRASTRILVRPEPAVVEAGADDDVEAQQQRHPSLLAGPTADLPLPKLNVCILVCGTHGDVLPFCGLAHALESLGHGARIAAHSIHRKTVKRAQKLDYYPLAGDPKQLSEWMVQTGGNFWGDAKHFTVIPQKMAMMDEIIRSCWPAVSSVEQTGADLEDNDEGAAAEPPAYVADAVIANPPCVGHIHVAQALGVPLHIMFPQPWYYPTVEFPHRE